MMSDLGDLQETVSDVAKEQDGAARNPAPSLDSEASSSATQGPLPDDHSDLSSPSPEASGLLSLPWEMVTHIASHLPAQCVISVLPKVCHVLGNVGKDSTAWQLRARRLVGSRAGFPVGPREDIDWPSACLEMEQLVTCWTGQADFVARLIQQDEEKIGQVVEQEIQGRHVEPAPEAQQGEGEAELQGVGVVAQEVAYGIDEGMEVAMEGEDGEVQPNEGADQLARLREALGERLENDGAALLEDEQGHRMAVNADGGQEGEQPADHGVLGNGKAEWMEQHQIPRSPSPPPTLDRISLPLKHFAQIDTILLLGGEATVCVTGSRDRNVHLWDLRSDGGKLRHTFTERGTFSTHQGWVWCLGAQGNSLASGAFDSTIRLWDLQACGTEMGLIRTGAPVHCLSYQPDVLLAGTIDRKVNMYDPRAAEPLVKSLRPHSKAVICLAADDKYILSGSTDCTVAMYDRRAGKALKRLRLNSYLMAMSYSGCEMWAGDNKGNLHSFSIAGNLKALSQFDVGHTALITGIHSSPGSLYTCSSDSTVKVHIPCAPPRTLCTLQHRGGVNALNVKAGVLAVAFGEFYAEIWRPRK